MPARLRSLETLRGDPDEEQRFDLADENAADPADKAVAQEEDDFYKSVLEAIKAKYQPNSKEAKFIDLLVEGWRDRPEVCDLLDIAAEFGEDRVADGLGAVLRQGELPLADLIEVGLRDPIPLRPQSIDPFIPDLSSYDALISEVAV